MFQPKKNIKLPFFPTMYQAQKNKIRISAKIKQMKVAREFRTSDMY